MLIHVDCFGARSTFYRSYILLWMKYKKKRHIFISLGDASKIWQFFVLFCLAIKFVSSLSFDRFRFIFNYPFVKWVVGRQKSMVLQNLFGIRSRWPLKMYKQCNANFMKGQFTWNAQSVWAYLFFGCEIISFLVDYVMVFSAWPKTINERIFDIHHLKLKMNVRLDFILIVLANDVSSDGQIWLSTYQYPHLISNLIALSNETHEK